MGYCDSVFVQRIHFVGTYEGMRFDVECQYLQTMCEESDTSHPNQFVQILSYT
jgi:hypothetical protein